MYTEMRAQTGLLLQYRPKIIILTTIPPLDIKIDTEAEVATLFAIFDLSTLKKVTS